MYLLMLQFAINKNVKYFSASDLPILPYVYACFSSSSVQGQAREAPEWREEWRCQRTPGDEEREVSSNTVYSFPVFPDPYSECSSCSQQFSCGTSLSVFVVCYILADKDIFNHLKFC